MQIEDQRETVEFLRDALARIDGAEAVETVETHISLVFIARTLAWKLKKAVRHPYLDFSTAGRRLATCERELALNRRTAPEIYLRMVPVRRAADGSALDPLRVRFGGAPVEGASRRFRARCLWQFHPARTRRDGRAARLC